MSDKKLKLFYYFLIIIPIIMSFGVGYLDDFISWQFGYDRNTMTLPFIYYYKYGMYPFEYYYLKIIRVDLYILWGLSLFCIMTGVKIKIWIINITYPIFIFLTCLIFSMLTLAMVF